MTSRCDGLLSQMNDEVFALSSLAPKTSDRIARETANRIALGIKYTFSEPYRFEESQLPESDPKQNFRDYINKAVTFAKEGSFRQANYILDLAQQSRGFADREFVDTIVSATRQIVSQFEQRRVNDMVNELKSAILSAKQSLNPDLYQFLQSMATDKMLTKEQADSLRTEMSKVVDQGQADIPRAAASIRRAISIIGALPKSIAGQFSRFVYDIGDDILEIVRQKTIAEISQTALSIGRWKQFAPDSIIGLKTKIVRRLSANTNRGSIDPVLQRIERNLNMASRISRLNPRSEEVEAAKTILEHRDYKNFKSGGKSLIKSAKFISENSNPLDRVIAVASLIQKSQNLFNAAVRNVPVYASKSGQTEAERASFQWERQSKLESVKDRLQKIAGRILDMSMKSSILSQSIALDPETIERRKAEIRERLKVGPPAASTFKFPRKFSTAPTFPVDLVRPEDVQETIKVTGSVFPSGPGPAELSIEPFINRIKADLTMAEKIVQEPNREAEAIALLGRARGLLATVMRNVPAWQFQMRPFDAKSENEEDAAKLKSKVNYNMFRNRLENLARRLAIASMKVKPLEDRAKEFFDPSDVL